MRTTFYFIAWKDQRNPRKITRKEAQDRFGEARFKEVMEDAKETFMEDPNVANEYMVADGRIGIEFS